VPDPVEGLDIDIICLYYLDSRAWQLNQVPPIFAWAILVVIDEIARNGG